MARGRTRGVVSALDVLVALALLGLLVYAVRLDWPRPGARPAPAAGTP